MIPTIPLFAQLFLVGLLGWVVARLLKPLILRLPMDLWVQAQDPDSHPNPPPPSAPLPQWSIFEWCCSILCMCIVGLHGLSFTTILLCGFVVVLLLLSAIDLRTLLLPDVLTQPLLWTGLIASALGWNSIELTPSFWGAVVGYVLLWSMASGFKAVTGQEGMGQGDFKLLAAIGAWLGWSMVPVVVLLSSLVGAVAGIYLKVRHSGSPSDTPHYIPFGPFLSGAAIVLVLWPNLPLIPQFSW